MLNPAFDPCGFFVVMEMYGKYNPCQDDPEAGLTVDDLRGHLVLGDDQIVGDGRQAVSGILVVLVARHPDHSLKGKKKVYIYQLP